MKIKEYYKSSVPIILDFIILFLSILLFFYGCYASRGFFWFPLLGLFLPWLLSIISSKFECDENNLVMYDLIRGKRTIPLSCISNIQIKVLSLNIHRIGSSIGYAHHYEFEMNIYTFQKKYKFRMSANKNIVEYLGYITNSNYYCHKVAFFKLKKYIEEQLNVRR